MAVKYKSSYKDINGQVWHIAVHDVDYGGTSPVEFVTQDGATLSYDGDTDSRTQLIITSTVSFTMMAQNNNDLDLVEDISAGEEGRFFLELYVNGDDYDAAEAKLFWRGILLPDFYEIEDQAFPQPITITATDDLAGLKDIEFTEDPESVGYSKIKGQLSLALNKLRTWTITADSVRAYLVKALEHNEDTYTGLEFWESAEANFSVYKNTDTNPPTFVSAYRALESVLAATGSRIYWQPSTNAITQSMFVVDSLHIHGELDSQVALAYRMDSGANLVEITIPRTTIDLNSTSFVRAAGWKRSYINALQRVEQKFSFEAQPFVDDWHYPHDYVTNATTVALTLPPTLLYNEGDAMSIRFTAKLNWEGDATLNGAMTATRWAVRVFLKIGQYYAHRPLVEQPDLSVFVPSIGNVTVYNATYATPEWNTTSTNRAQFISPVAIMNSGGSFTLPFALDMPPFPADLTSDDAEFSISIVAITNTGTIASYGNQFDGDSYKREVEDFTVFPTDLIDIEGNTVIFKAENTAGVAREVAELPTPLYTTKIGNKGGGLFIDTGTGRVQATAWHSLYEAGDHPLPTLITKHFMQAQKGNLRKMFGQFYDIRTSLGNIVPGFYHTYRNGGVKYSLHNWSYNTNDATHDVTLIEIRKFAGVTLPPAGFEDEIVTPPSPGNGWDTVMTNADQTTATIQQKTDLITITSPIDLDSGLVTSVNGVGPVSGDVTIDSDDVGWTGAGGGSVTSAIGANTSNIDNLKSYVVADTDKVELKEDASNKIAVDGATGSQSISLTVAGTAVLRLNSAEAIFTEDITAPSLEATESSSGLVLSDSTGQRWKVTMNTDGTLRTTSL